MALTPEDVVNKRFQQTKFREGYDQDEVDDFLDEIVIELRRLIAENEELRRELDAAVARENERPQEPQVATVATPQPFAGPAQPQQGGAPQMLGGQPLPTFTDDPSTPQNEETESMGLIALAQRLHNDHVAQGQSRRDELIADGQEQARKLIADAELNARNIATEAEANARNLLGEAENQAKQIVADAEARAKETIGRLEEQQQRLEGRIEELRVFEREYRNKLRAYIEGQLNDLNRQSPNVEPQGPAAQQQ